MEKYDIKKFVELVWKQPTQDAMELITHNEVVRVHKGNVDNLPPKQWIEYVQQVFDVYGFVRGGKFRIYLPEYKPLVEKLRNQK